MSKKILILSGSPRKHGNSDLLCDEFLKGAGDKGHMAEKIFLHDKKIAHCIGCCSCYSYDNDTSSGVCAIKDDMAQIYEKMCFADVIVMASPVYFYSVSGVLKTFIDRCFAKWKEIKNKEFYYLLTAGEDSTTAKDCALECLRGFAKCLEGSVEKGFVFAKGVYEKGQVKNTKYMKQAYEMGKSVN